MSKDELLESLNDIEELLGPQLEAARSRKKAAERKVVDDEHKKNAEARGAAILDATCQCEDRVYSSAIDRQQAEQKYLDDNYSHLVYEAKAPLRPLSPLEELQRGTKRILEAMNYAYSPSMDPETRDAVELRNLNKLDNMLSSMPALLKELKKGITTRKKFLESKVGK